MRNLYLYLINESNIEILFDSGNGLEISFNLLFLFDVEFSGKNVPIIVFTQKIKILMSATKINYDKMRVIKRHSYQISI